MVNMFTNIFKCRRSPERYTPKFTVSKEMLVHEHAVRIIRKEYFRVRPDLRRGIRCLHIAGPRPEGGGFYCWTDQTITVCGLQHCRRCVRSLIYHELGHHCSKTHKLWAHPDWTAASLEFGRSLSWYTEFCHQKMERGEMDTHTFAGEVFAEFFVGRHGSRWSCFHYSWDTYRRLLPKWNSLFGRD